MAVLLSQTAGAQKCPPRRIEVPAVGLNLAEQVEGAGYGSRAIDKTLARVADTGSNTVALVVAARMDGLHSNRITTSGLPKGATLTKVVARAHRLKMRVMVMPHIWIDEGLWRGDILRQGAAADAFFAAYGQFINNLASDSERACVDALSIGVELKGLSTQAKHSQRFKKLIAGVRQRFGGVLTYSANWDEAGEVVFWDQLDLISVNGFTPIARTTRPDHKELLQGARAMLAGFDRLAMSWERPVLLHEVGYKAITDNAREPWLWPDPAKQMAVDQASQQRSYRALVQAVQEYPRIVGVLFWLEATGVDDKNARPFEPAWGFSPMGKLAETELRKLGEWARQRHSAVGRTIDPPGPGAAKRRP